MTKRRWGLFALMFGLLFLSAGCQSLTVEQKDALGKLEDDLYSLEKKAATYERRLGELGPLVVEAKEAHEAGRLPAAELAAIVADVAAKREADLALLSETKADIRGVSGDVAALREQDVPVWRIVLPFVTAILGVASGYIPGARRANLRERERDAVISGVEKTGGADVKASIRNAAVSAGVERTLHAAVRAIT